MSRTAIVWFRRDLRLTDNEALTDALANASSVVPIYILSDDVGEAGSRGTGEARWLAHSLKALDAQLHERGSRLIVRTGPAARVLVELAREYKAAAVYCSRDWSPGEVELEQGAQRALRDAHVALEVSRGSVLVEPDALGPKSGDGSYRVFAPYFNAWERAWGDLSLLPAPNSIPAPRRWPTSELLPEPPGPSGPDPTGWWEPGERGGQVRLAEFVAEGVEAYTERRDRPDVDGTSRLSPHLAFGEVSPREVVATVTAAGIDCDLERVFLRQLAWREFSTHVVHHNPAMLTAPLRHEFDAMPWSDDGELFGAWQRGMTGYPLVDAGMRQLAATGWMHNRVRMVAASLLTKDMLVDWRSGLAHFAELLTDHQVPVNVFNWQWVAGCGADAAPYFRIFNPTLQASRYDPHGTYIRQWVPELANVPDRWISRPWEMSAEEAAAAGIEIGADYPAPIVDHTEAHRRALAAYAAIRS